MSEEEALSAEEEAPSADAASSVRAWWSCENYFESEECGRDPRALFSMTVGNPVTSRKYLFLKVTDEPFISHRCWAKELKPNAKLLRSEIIRRSKAYVYEDISECPRPTSWTVGKATSWLKEHPISVAADLEYLYGEINITLRDIIKADNAAVITPATDRGLHTKWTDAADYLRLYHMLTDAHIRAKFAEIHVVNSREEIDARNSSQLSTNFYAAAATKFNDADWMPDSLAIPDVHPDFAVSRKLPLSVPNLDAISLKKRFVDCRAKMVLVMSRWKMSGSGAAMRVMDEEGNCPTVYELDRRTEQVYEFNEGDDHQSFLQSEPSHILYLWHVAQLFEILDTVQQQLKDGILADGAVPLTQSEASSCPSERKRKLEEFRTTIQAETAADFKKMNKTLERLVSAADKALIHKSRTEANTELNSMKNKLMEMEFQAMEATTSSGDSPKEALYKKCLTRLEDEIVVLVARVADLDKKLN